MQTNADFATLWHLGPAILALRRRVVVSVEHQRNNVNLARARRVEPAECKPDAADARIVCWLTAGAGGVPDVARLVLTPDAEQPYRVNPIGVMLDGSGDLARAFMSGVWRVATPEHRNTAIDLLPRGSWVKESKRAAEYVRTILEVSRRAAAGFYLVAGLGDGVLTAEPEEEAGAAPEAEAPSGAAGLASRSA